MKKVFISFILVILTALLSAEIPYQLVKLFPDVSSFYLIFAGSIYSIALAVIMYAKIYDDDFPPYKIGFGTITFADKISDLKNPSPLSSRKGMIQKGDKLSPEHKTKIAATKKRKAEERKAQDERIQKTREAKLARKKSVKS